MKAGPCPVQDLDVSERLPSRITGCEKCSAAQLSHQGSRHVRLQCSASGKQKLQSVYGLSSEMQMAYDVRFTLGSFRDVIQVGMTSKASAIFKKKSWSGSSLIVEAQFHHQGRCHVRLHEECNTSARLSVVWDEILVQGEETWS